MCIRDRSDGNGFELCKLIKPQHPDTIVIFLTANDQESDQIRGYEAVSYTHLDVYKSQPTFCVKPVGIPPHFLKRFQISTE